MAAVDFSQIALSTDQLDAMSQFLMKMLPNVKELQALHNFVTGVKNGKRIGYNSGLSLTGIKDTLTVRPDSGAKMSLGEIEVMTELIGDTLTFKAEDFDRLLKPYSGKFSKYNDIFFENGTGNDVVSTASMLFLESILHALFRLSWFGKKTVAAAGASTPGLKDANHVKFFNVVDGFWEQIFASVTAAGEDDCKFTHIAKNDGATLALQEFTAGDSVLIFRKMWKLAKAELRESSKKFFGVTQVIFDDYEDYLISKGQNAEVDLTMYGVPMLKYKGTNVVNMDAIWQSNNLFINGTTNEAGYLPHRAVLTTNDNLGIFTLSSSDLGSIESNYEKKLREYWMAYGFTLQPAIFRKDLLVAAY